MATRPSIPGLEKSEDRGVWRELSPWGCRELDMTEHALASWRNLMKLNYGVRMQDRSRVVCTCVTFGPTVRESLVCL